MKYYILAFAAGALCGFAGSWYFAKQHYEDIANQDFKKRLKESRSEKSPVEKIEKAKPKNAKTTVWSGDKGDLKDYVDYINKYDSRDVTTIPKRKKKQEVEEEQPEDTIKIISEEEFGEDDEYDIITLTYYANDILADDNNEIIDNRLDIVGDIDYLNEFDEDDSIYVVNNNHKAYYEILRDEDAYPDARPIRNGA